MLIRITRVSLLIIGLWICLSNSTTAAQSTDFSDLDTFINKMMQGQINELNVPNATISIVSDGEVIFEQGYGYSNIEQQTNVDPAQTLFRIGSTSKLFTWTAVMQLVEQGKLDLDTDVNEYIDFEISDQLEFGPNNSSTQPITLRHLMTHTPGFEDYSDSIFRLSANETLPLNEYVRTYLPKRVFPAGEVLAYSNYGSALAGYIVESVSGIPFTDYVEEHIFNPLHMTDSSFQQPLPEHLEPHMTNAYRSIDGEYKQGNFEFVPAPAGGMSSTASDMATFMITYLDGGKLNNEYMLNEQTVKQMFQQQFTHHTRLDGMGLGFIEQTFNDKRALIHSGSTMLFDSGLYLFPEEDIGIFIAYSGANYSLHTEIVQAFLSEYFPPEEPPKIIQASNTSDQRMYVGEYHQNRKSFTTEEKIISLTMGTIRVEEDGEGYLAVTNNGEVNRFAEIEPGIYENLREDASPDPLGNFRTIVFESDKEGNTMLMTDGPMTYSKASWYSSSAFTFVSLIASVLFIIGTLISWGVAALYRIIFRKKKDRNKLKITIKTIGVGYGLATVLLILSIILSGEIDPVYQLPKVAFGVVPAWSSFQILPLIAIILLGIPLFPLTVVVWWKKLWKVYGRIHFSLLTGTAGLLIWLFNYWNVF